MLVLVHSVVKGKPKSRRITDPFDRNAIIKIYGKKIQQF